MQLSAWVILAPVSIALALIDLRTHRLPNYLVGTSFLLGVVGFGVSASGLHAVVLFVVYLLLYLMSRGGIGMGDVKLAAVVGLYAGQLGWSAVALATWLAFVSAGVVALAGMALKRISLRSHIPFGPFMVAGLWLSVLVSRG